MLDLGLRLLGIWGWLKKGLKALAGLVGRYPLQAALIASLCLSGWLWRGWNKEQAAHAETARQWKAAANAWKAASDANKAAAIAQVKAVEAKSAQIAKDADNAHQIALSDARTAADRYANRMRLDRVCRSNTASPSEDQPAPRDNGPGEGSELVAITREDFDRATENALRLQAINAWGETLIGAGLAKRELPSPAF